MQWRGIFSCSEPRDCESVRTLGDKWGGRMNLWKAPLNNFTEAQSTALTIRNQAPIMPSFASIWQNNQDFDEELGPFCILFDILHCTVDVRGWSHPIRSPQRSYDSIVSLNECGLLEHLAGIEMTRHSLLAGH